MAGYGIYFLYFQSSQQPWRVNGVFQISQTKKIHPQNVALSGVYWKWTRQEICMREVYWEVHVGTTPLRKRQEQD